MRIGKWRNRVVLQGLGLSDDAFGQGQQVWSDIAAYWAEVWTLKGDERAVAEQFKPVATHRVRCRNDRGGDDTIFNPKQRFMFGSRYLHILSVNISPDRRYAELICQEQLIGGQ